MLKYTVKKQAVNGIVNSNLSIMYQGTSSEVPFYFYKSSRKLYVVGQGSTHSI